MSQMLGAGSPLLMHDRTTIAWVIVLAYAVAAVLSVAAGRAAGAGRDRRLWYWTAAGLIALGINKQLDLQTLLTAAGRDLARAQGWYEFRRPVQEAFIVALAACCVAAAALLVARLRGAGRAVKLAGVGIVLLITFILIRAASFHHVGQWLGVRLGRLSFGNWLELCGILVIAAAARAATGWRESRRESQ